MHKLLSALTNYTEQFYSNTDFTSSNVVASPLGSWLLVASISSGLNLESTPELKTSLEKCLGMSIEEASASVQEVLEEFPALNYVSKAWTVENLAGLPAVQEWVTANSVIPYEGSIPSQAEIDAWVANNTNKLINQFPAQLDSSTLLIIANIIYSKLTWNTRFSSVSANDSMKEWGVDNVLRIVATENVDFVRNTEGDIFAAYEVEAAGKHKESVVLVSCLTKEMEPRELIKTAHEVPQMTSVVLDADVLQQIPESALRVKEVRRGMSPMVVEINTPAWEAETKHSLLENKFLGYQEVITALSKDSTINLAVEATQVAVAKFDKDGFEAAALTSLVMARCAMPTMTTQTIYELNFSNPFAFVSYTEELPVFSGYISIAKES